MELILSLPEHYVKDQVCSFLCLNSLVKLDTAVANKAYRSSFLQIIFSCALHMQSVVVYASDKYAMRWLCRRNVGVSQLTIILDNAAAICFLRLRALPIATRALSLRYCANGAIKNDHKCFVGYADLQQLRLYDCAPLHIKTLTKLTSLEIYRARTLTDCLVELICANCREIRHLTLMECDQLTPVCIPVIAKNYPELLTLYIRGGISTMDDSCLEIIGQHCRLLQNACLHPRFPTYTDQGVLALTMGCRDLRKLGLYSNFSIHAIGVYCPRMHVLRIRSLDCLTDESFDTLASSFTNLQVLHMDRSQRNSAGSIVSFVQQCRTLHTLVLTGRSHINDNLFRRLAPALAHLQALGVPSAEYITDYSIALVAVNCPLLRKLDVNGCDGLTEYSVEALALHSVTLQVLHAYGCEAVTDKSLLQLARNGSLVELDVRGCEDITSQGVEQLQLYCMFKYLCVDAHLVCAVPQKMRPPLGDYDLDQFE